MRFIVPDTETDGLLDQLTTIHSLVLRDLETDEVLSCTNSSPEYPSIEDGLKVLAAAEKVYFHNGIKFDLPAIQKLYPAFTLRGQLMDTLVVAQFRFAHIKDNDYERIRRGKMPKDLAGSHSLEAWGYRLGLHKGEYTKWCEEQGIEDPWKTWRPEMQTYCEQDTAVGKALVEYLKKYLSKEMNEAVETEHELAYYLAQQERNGWPIDREKLIALIARLSARREELSRDLIEKYGRWFAANGVTVPKKTTQYKATAEAPPRLIVEGAPYTKLKEVEFNPGSRHHITKILKEQYGWVPEEFTDGGEPKLDEDILLSLTERMPEAAAIVEYLVVEKRLGTISEGKQAWTRHLTDANRIHGRVKQNHAITHRAAHASPNVGQVPGCDSPYGPECREIWTVPAGWLLVGADASGLELRCLAHDMAAYDGGAYGRTILEGRNEDGTDIHSVNQRAAGLATRSQAKTFIYAFLYGAGDEKIGSIVNPTASPQEQARIGKRLKKQFLQNLPALKLLIDDVKATAKKERRLRALDGRWVYIRSDHAALNTRLQSSGAIICKRWIVEYNRRLVREFGPQGWNGKWAGLGWIHDETQLAVRPEIVEPVKQILVDSIRSMTQHFNFRIPLDGEAKVGKNWKDTH